MLPACNVISADLINLSGPQFPSLKEEDVDWLTSKLFHLYQCMLEVSVITRTEILNTMPCVITPTPCYLCKRKVGQR